MQGRRPTSSRRVVLTSLALGSALWWLPSTTRADAKLGKPWLGVSMTGGSGGGVLVDFVFRRSPAEVARLETHDMLVSVDGVALDEPRDLVDHIQRRTPGMTVTLRVRRSGRERSVRIELGRHPGPDAINRLMYVGNAAPELIEPTAVQGDLPSLTGGVTLIDFFASWCTVCRSLTPRLSELHKKHKRKRLAIIGMTTDTPDLAQETVDTWKIPFAVGSDATQRTNAAYKVTAIPALFVVDQKGIIRDVMIGYDPGRFAALEKHIEKLLAKG